MITIPATTTASMQRQVRVRGGRFCTLLSNVSFSLSAYYTPPALIQPLAQPDTVWQGQEKQGGYIAVRQMHGQVPRIWQSNQPSVPRAGTLLSLQCLTLMNIASRNAACSSDR